LKEIVSDEEFLLFGVKIIEKMKKIKLTNFNLLSAIEKSLQAGKIHAAKNEKITIFQPILPFKFCRQP